MKGLSKNIREFEKLPYKSYERRRLKHDPTDNYFYLTRQLTKCMTRDYFLNSQVYPARMEKIGTKQILISHVFSTDKSELKEFLVDKTLSQVCSTDEDESTGII